MTVRMWVRQAEIDAGKAPGMASKDADELNSLRQEVKELRRANDILKKASAFRWSSRSLNVRCSNA